jgi:hypothetical protein
MSEGATLRLRKLPSQLVRAIPIGETTLQWNSSFIAGRAAAVHKFMQKGISLEPHRNIRAKNARRGPS